MSCRVVNDVEKERRILRKGHLLNCVTTDWVVLLRKPREQIKSTRGNSTSLVLDSDTLWIIGVPCHSSTLAGSDSDKVLDCLDDSYR